jgi:hypothetical protein
MTQLVSEDNHPVMQYDTTSKLTQSFSDAKMTQLVSEDNHPVTQI